MVSMTLCSATAYTCGSIGGVLVYARHYHMCQPPQPPPQPHACRGATTGAGLDVVFRAVYTGTRPGLTPSPPPPHQGEEGVAGTPGACSQAFCHPIRCMRYAFISTDTYVKHTVRTTTTTTTTLKVRRVLRTRGRNCSPSRAHPRRLLSWRAPSSGCGSGNAMLARLSSGTDVLTVKSGGLQLVSRSCHSAKGMRRERCTTGTGTRVPPRLTSLLFLLSEELHRQPRTIYKYWAGGCSAS